MFDIAFSVVGIFGLICEEQNAVTKYDWELQAKSKRKNAISWQKKFDMI
jgi:hypothetical protein